MKLNKITSFLSPKTGGTTIVSANLALLEKMKASQLNIAFLQVSRFPDAHVFFGVAPAKNIFNIHEFLSSAEMTEDIKNKIKRTQGGVDIFLSPSCKFWQYFSVDNFSRIFAEIMPEYDHIYIDIDTSVPDEICEFLFEQSEKIVITSFLDPASLGACESFFEKYTEEFLPKLCFIANQCPNDQKSFINKTLKQYAIRFLGTLPVETKHMWAQLFTGFPLVFQKKSRLKKPLEKILDLLSV